MNTSSFREAESFILSQFRKREIKIVDMKAVEMGFGTGELFKTDKDFWYIMKWEKQPFYTVQHLVNQEAGHQVIPPDAFCRTFNQQSCFEFIEMHPASAILFCSQLDQRSRPTNTVLFISSMDFKRYRYPLKQPFNDEPVFVIEDSHMDLWADAEEENEFETPSDQAPSDYVPPEDEDQTTFDNFDEGDEND